MRRQFWKLVALALVVGQGAVSVDRAAAQEQKQSVCRGTTSAGSLENACKLPGSGKNFSSYSTLASVLGRTYVHCTVRRILLDAFAELAESHPDLRFVYGETGFADGGPFKPHKTHQNGLSVDLFVPVRNAAGKIVLLPMHAFNKWGYELEFDAEGRYDNFTIDFEALALHILALDRSAKKHGVGIWRVIFDPKLQPHLHRTTSWPALRGKVQFSKRRSWVRHDEHIHVDFAVPCEPL